MCVCALECLYCYLMVCQIRARAPATSNDRELNCRIPYLVDHLSSARRRYSHAVHAAPGSQSDRAPLQRHECDQRDGVASHQRHCRALGRSGHSARRLPHRQSLCAGHVRADRAPGVPTHPAGRVRGAGCRLCADNRIRRQPAEPHRRTVWQFVRESGRSDEVSNTYQILSLCSYV